MASSRRAIARWAVAMLAAVGASRAGAINITIDYTYDSAGFFGANPAAAVALEAAAADLSGFLDDAFTAIETPEPFTSQTFDGVATWTWTAFFNDPAGTGQLSVTDRDIDADEYLIFAGAEPMTGDVAGRGSPGWYSITADNNGGFFTQAEINQIDAITDDFFSDITTRGQASGFSRWGGAITFDNDGSTLWHFDHTGPVAASTADFYSVALHELVHALGFGNISSTTETVWETLLGGTLDDPYFTGARAVEAYGGNVPVEPNIRAHWAEGTASTTLVGHQPQEAAMDPSLTEGQRKLLTVLDAAGLIDLGWEIDIYTLGDFNLDGVVTNTDIQAMLDALVDLSGYKAANELTDADLVSIGDINGSGAVTNADIQALLDLLTGGDMQTIPEPASVGLVLLTLLARARRPR